VILGCAFMRMPATRRPIAPYPLGSIALCRTTHTGFCPARQNLLFSCQVSDPRLDFSHITMARARAAEHQRPRSKNTLIEEVTLGISKLQEVLAAINDLSQEGFPYRDAAQSKAELQFRECLRRTFGERSQEFQAYRNFRLRTDDKGDAAHSLSVIKGLIHTLEDRKLELQGLKSPPKKEPSPEVSHTTTARMVLISSATPTTLTGQAESPMTVAVAMTANVGSPISPPIFTPTSQPPIPEPSTIAPAPYPAPAPSLPSTPTPAIAAFIPSSLLPLEIQPATDIDRSVKETPASPPPLATPIPAPTPTQPHSNPPPPGVDNQSMPSEIVVPAPQTPPPDKQEIDISVDREVEPALVQDPHNLIRKVCLRFHSVARQLRLRKDYRPTLEIDDDYDLQDLLCALLKIEFDEVSTDEWTPSYTAGAPRTTLLLNRDQIAVVAKKTRPGLTTKELADQVTADSAYYRAQGRCSTLFCFIYDPEGRIGSPKRLETTLTCVSEHCRVEVLVAPK
jgi:hypothetical protein